MQWKSVPGPYSYSRRSAPVPCSPIILPPLSDPNCNILPLSWWWWWWWPWLPSYFHLCPLSYVIYLVMMMIMKMMKMIIIILLPLSVQNCNILPSSCPHIILGHILHTPCNIIDRHFHSEEIPIAIFKHSSFSRSQDVETPTSYQTRCKVVLSPSLSSPLVWSSTLTTTALSGT